MRILRLLPTCVGIVLASGSALFLPGPRSASAQGIEGLRPCLTELGDQLARFLKGKKETAVAVGAFTSAQAGDSLSPAIQKALIEELEKQGLRVLGDADLKVRGEYQTDLDKRSALLEFRVTARLVNGQGKVVKEFPKAERITNADLIPQVLLMTRGDLGAGVSPEMAAARTVQQPQAPTVHVRKAEIRAEDRSPYAVEIHVKSGDEYRPVSPTVEDGCAFVPLRRDDVFAVKLINGTDRDAAVRLSLDGLSMFAFSEQKGYGSLLVPRRGSVLVCGWFRSLQDTDEFLVTAYPKSAAFQLDSPARVGAVTAAFTVAWDPKTESRPEDEMNEPRSLDTAIGRGKAVKAPHEEVTRCCGRIRDVVTVRYRKGLNP